MPADAGERSSRPGASAARLLELVGPAAQRFGVPLEPIASQLAAFAETLLQWNQRINLTGARSLEALAREHIADALAVVPHLPAAPARWIDVGSGAGLPGIVLALARPDLSGVLLEPIEKRRAFLAAVARLLRLARVEVVGERAEEHLARGGSHAYDLAVSRAVFALPDWLALGPRFVAPGGVLLGLEGASQTSLPPGAERLPYDIGLGARALIRVRC